jgi:hypothetical protein
MSRKRTAFAVLTTTAAALTAVATPGFSAVGRGDLPAPPHCTATDNGKQAILHIPTPGLPGGHPLYVRFCGPAQAVVRLGGSSYRIRGGSCTDTTGYEAIRIGLHAFAHAPVRASFLAFVSSAAPAVFIQLPGIRYATGQATTSGTPIRSGRFSGHLRNGTPFDGSWTCG